MWKKLIAMVRRPVPVKTPVKNETAVIEIKKVQPAYQPELPFK